MQIQSFDHVGINVANLVRSADWYRRVLGFEIVHKWTTTWMIGRGQMRIGLFERPDAKPVEDIDNRFAITHFAFLVDAEGFQNAQDELRSTGIPFDPPDDTGIAYSIFFKDPDGYELEFTTYHAVEQEGERNQVQLCRR